MMKRIALFAAGVAATLIASAPAFAGFTTVNISFYLNGNVSTAVQEYPVGYSTGNTGTGIPFMTYTHGGSGYMGSAFLRGQSSPGSSSTLTIDLSSQNITGQVSFYALLNNYYGRPGVDEYTVAINFSDGTSESYASIGGQDTRDYNQNTGTDNTIANTTSNWWTNAATAGANYQRLDVREFTIAAADVTKTISSFEITQLQSNDPAFISGLTFSTDAALALAPEPASLAILGTGVAAIELRHHRRASR